MYGVKPEDAKVLCARQDLFPKSQPLKVSAIEAKIQQYLIRLREKDLIGSTYKSMFKDSTGKLLDFNTMNDIMLEMYKDGSVKQITAQLVMWGSSTETAQILMSVFDDVKHKVAWKTFEQVILGIVSSEE